LRTIVAYILKFIHIRDS